MANKVEDKAVSIVIAYELKECCECRDARKDKPKTGVDVISSDRYIEVKGSSAEKPTWVNMGNHNIEAFKKYGDKYWLYIVYNINGNPKLLRFNHDDILSRRTSHEGWYVNFGKNERKKCIDVSKL